MYTWAFNCARLFLGIGQVRLHVMATGGQNGSTPVRAVCRMGLQPSRPSVLAGVRLTRTRWSGELPAETRCHAWLGYGYTGSETVREIAALTLIFMSLGRHLPKCTETIVSNWDRYMQEDDCFGSRRRPNYILLTTKQLKSRHDVTSGRATQFPLKCQLHTSLPSGLETSSATRGGEMTGGQTRGRLPN